MSKTKSFEKSFLITEENIKLFAEVTGDKNPIHIDEEYAKGTIFKERICHGMLIGSYISAIIGNDFPGRGTIYLSQVLFFKKPVKIEDVISIKISFIEAIKKNRIRLITNCTNQFGETVVEGEAVVIPPESFYLL